MVKLTFMSSMPIMAYKQITTAKNHGKHKLHGSGHFMTELIKNVAR